MSADKFKSLVQPIIKNKVAISGSQQSAINEIAREYERGSLAAAAAVQKLQGVFADVYQLERHDWEAIAKALERN